MPKAASSKVKNRAANRSGPIQYTYIVVEKESGPYRETESNILGSYESLGQANSSAKIRARSNYSDYWSSDEGDFEYPLVTQDANGCVSIMAESQEGDAWSITVNRHVTLAANDVKPKAAEGGATGGVTTLKNGRADLASSTTPTKRGRPHDSINKAKAATSSASTSSTAMTHVYLVWKIEDPRRAETTTDVSRIYKSRDEANAYARSMARSDFAD